MGLAQDLEAVADAERRHPLASRVDDLGHHRREASDRTAAQVVAVREAARQHDRVDPLEVDIAVPQRDGLATCDLNRSAGVDVVERAGEGDDADLHCCSTWTV